MANVKIEKFVGGVYETSFTVPAFVLVMAKTLLPMTALSALAERGIPVRDILEANARGASYSSMFEVREHGIDKQISVSLNQTIAPALHTSLQRRLP
ncbi:MAG: hypothetical protein KJ850_11385 [Gammaproteobacteria bacterium]|nr:hypothetical protein [Gammaproteobacteria bacterium]MBU1625632.1 hypothetical protein [Gammaproteobacteria bacterium]MBU1980892.1 hypothetical protein [Gammaproteobacteria bacterium]